MARDAAPPPGWYADSSASGPSLRYWDGTRWVVPDVPGGAGTPGRGPAVVAAGPGAKGPRSRGWWRAVRWGAVGTFVLVAGVVVYVLAQGQQVCQVNMQGEFTFAAEGEQCVARAELAKQQDELAQDVAGTKEEAASAPVVPSVADLNGTWSAAGGVVYVITQGGGVATIEEVSPTYGLTGTGTGTVGDQGASFDFTAFDGSVGYVELTLQGPDTLVGTFVNTTHSTTSPAYLTRTG